MWAYIILLWQRKIQKRLAMISKNSDFICFCRSLISLQCVLILLFLILEWWESAQICYMSEIIWEQRFNNNAILIHTWEHKFFWYTMHRNSHTYIYFAAFRQLTYCSKKEFAYLSGCNDFNWRGRTIESKSFAPQNISLD